MISFRHLALYSYPDLERAFQVKHAAVAKLVRRGKITPVRIGNRYWFKGSDLVNFLRNVQPLLRPNGITDYPLD